MPSTRRSLLTALAVASSGCTALPSGTNDDESPGNTPDDPPGTPPAPESVDGPSFARWGSRLPDDVGLLSLGGAPETPAIFVGAPAGPDVDGHALYALSLQGGDERWRVGLSAPALTPPMFAGTEETPRVLFGTGDGDVSAVRAVDYDAGDSRWEFAAEGPSTLFPIETTDETVFVGYGGEAAEATTGRVYAFGAVDGGEEWVVETDPVSRDGNARRRDTLLVTTGGRLQALGVADGEERWGADAEAVGFDNRAERVFLLDDGVARGLALADGAELWRREFDTRPTDLVTPRAAMDETVFVGDDEGQLHALSSLDGDTRWTRSVAEGEFEPSVVRTSEHLFVAGDVVRALDPVSGDEQWSFDPDAEGPVGLRASRTVFVNADGSLWALDPSTGDRRWEFAPDGGLAGIANAGNFAFVGTGDAVYALDGSESA